MGDRDRRGIYHRASNRRVSAPLSMRRPDPRRSASAIPFPALDRRQKFALFGSILGIALVGFALPQLVGFLSERGDVLSGVFPARSAEPSPDDERSTFGGFVANPSSTPTPLPTPAPTASSDGALTPTPGGNLVGPFVPGNPAAPTGAPIATRSPSPAPAPTTGPPATPVPTTAPSPSPVPTTAPTPSPAPTTAPTATPLPSPTLPELPPDAPTRAECSDGIDNDQDLFTDTGVLGFLLGDPDCSSASDTSEGS